jgi:hypothetical protein
MTKCIYRSVVGLLVCVLTSTAIGAEPQGDSKEELRDQVQELELRVKTLEELILPMKGEILARTRASKLRKHFEERTAQDRKIYSQDELKEISRLYQIANRRWNTPEAKESLKKLIEKYDKANRTGCALLYLGQMTKGEEKEKYLEMAIADFSDCAYGDGVQVGPYARFHLAFYYDSIDRDDDAKKLFDSIRKNYPAAIDHKGNLLVDKIPE